MSVAHDAPSFEIFITKISSLSSANFCLILRNVHHDTIAAFEESIDLTAVIVEDCGTQQT
jgi:hypothetical protein